MADDPIWGSIGSPLAKVARLHLAAANESPLILRKATLREANDIPPRPWLLGTILLRGYVTVLIAPGGTGKTSWGMTAAASVATGIELLGLKVWEKANVAVFNEDSQDELDRRLAAIVIRYNLDPETLKEAYFLNSCDDRSINMGVRGPNGEIEYPDEEALVQLISFHNIGLLMIDPFSESHSLEENSNPDMIEVAAAWRRIARRTNSAILLIHHVRKGGEEAGIDASRGAKGLTDSARVGLLMNTMSESDAEKLGVAKEKRYGYVRIDDPKANMAPRYDKATWFRLEQVELGNGTSLYPRGDNVAVIMPWSPPRPFANVTSAELNKVLDILERGVGPGQYYGRTRKGSSSRWAGNAIRQVCPQVENGPAQQIIDAWLENGVLTAIEFRDANRKSVTGVQVCNEKRPT